MRFSVILTYSLLVNGALAEPEFRAPQQPIATVHRVILETNTEQENIGNRDQNELFELPDLNLQAPPELPPGITATEFPFISIRAVCDVKPLANRNGNNADIQNFELQRQRKQPSTPWSNWEHVDSKQTIEILMNSSGFELGPVPASLTDFVITCPLPHRLTGQWSRAATHPGLIEYSIEEENLLAERLYTIWRFNLLNSPIEPSEDQILNQATSNDEAQLVEAWMKKRPELEKLGIKLFRYFDFDIEPGVAYKYRLRLVLDGQDETAKKTPWSDITTQLMVPDDYVIERDGNVALKRWWMRWKAHYKKSAP